MILSKEYRNRAELHKIALFCVVRLGVSLQAIFSFMPPPIRRNKNSLQSVRNVHRRSGVSDCCQLVVNWLSFGVSLCVYESLERSFAQTFFLDNLKTGTYSFCTCTLESISLSEVCVRFLSHPHFRSSDTSSSV